MAWLDGSGVDPSKFLHPYGVSNRTNDDGREEDELCESAPAPSAVHARMAVALRP